MSAPIGPGDYVECIQTTGLYGFVVGAIYQVDEVSPFDSCEACDGCVGILLERMPRPALNRYFGSCNFRPIYRRSDKILKSVLLPVDEEAHA